MQPAKRLATRATLHFALIQIFVNMAACAATNFAAVYLIARGFSNTQLGVTVGLANGLGMLGQILIASLLDKSKTLTTRRVITVLAVALTALLAGVALVPSVVLVIAFVYVGAIAVMHTKFALMNTLAMETANSGVAINFSLARGVGSLFFSGLAFSLGYLSNAVGPLIIIPLAAAFTAVEVALVAGFRYAPPAAQKAQKAEAAVGYLTFLRRHPRFVGVLVGLALVYFTHMLISTFLLQVLLFRGGTAGDVGLANGLAALVELPSMALFPLLLRKVKDASILLRVAVVGFFVKALLTFLAPTAGWVVLVHVFQFFAFALATPAQVYYVNQVIPQADLAKGQSSIIMTQYIGTMLASLLGGVILDFAGGVTFLLAVGVGVNLAGLLVVFLAIGRRKPATA